MKYDTPIRIASGVLTAIAATVGLGLPGLAQTDAPVSTDTFRLAALGFANAREDLTSTLELLDFSGYVSQNVGITNDVAYETAEAEIVAALGENPDVLILDGWQFWSNVAHFAATTPDVQFVWVANQMSPDFTEISAMPNVSVINDRSDVAGRIVGSMIDAGNTRMVALSQLGYEAAFRVGLTNVTPDAVEVVATGPSYDSRSAQLLQELPHADTLITTFDPATISEQLLSEYQTINNDEPLRTIRLGLENTAGAKTVRLGTDTTDADISVVYEPAVAVSKILDALRSGKSGADETMTVGNGIKIIAPAETAKLEDAIARYRDDSATADGLPAVVSHVVQPGDTIDSILETTHGSAILDFAVKSDADLEPGQVVLVMAEQVVGASEQPPSSTEPSGTTTSSHSTIAGTTTTTTTKPGVTTTTTKPVVTTTTTKPVVTTTTTKPKDDCPFGDYSGSQYDGTCGTPPPPPTTLPPPPTTTTQPKPAISECINLGVSQANEWRTTLGYGSLSSANLGSCDWAKHLAELGGGLVHATGGEVLFLTGSGSCAAAWSAWQNSAVHYSIITTPSATRGDFKCVTNNLLGRTYAVGRVS